MKKFRLLSVICFMSILFFACKKESATNRDRVDSNFPEVLSPNPPGDTYPPETEDPWEDAQNEENPYDANGYYHNKNLDFIFANIGTDTSNANMYDQSIGYIDSEFGHTVSGDVTSGIPFASSTVTTVFNVSDDLSISSYQSGINNLPVRTVVKNELSDLLDILTDTTRSYYSDFAVTKSLIISWEANLNAGLTDPEEEFLLRAGSIARYSSLYWTEYAATIGTNGFLKWLGWGLVGAADAIGGFVGAGVCGPACAIGLGGAASFAGFRIFKARGWEPF